MQIVVTCKETIKPSSPTPDHLRTLKLSLLDQFVVATEINTRFLLFYSAQGDVRRFENTNTSRRLKESLSRTLTEFYPLAGRFSSNDLSSIDCNDSGVEYIEARVRAPLVLDQLLGCPCAEELKQLYPPPVHKRTKQGLCSIQVTIFEGCGSMVIGVQASHVVGDISALAKFVDGWSTLASGGKIVSPKFGMGDVFPPSNLFEGIDETDPQEYNDLDQVQKLITKRFVFSKSEIAALLANCANHQPRTTRVQVVCGFIFKCLVSVVRLKSSKPIFMSMPISWSRAMSQPVPPNYVGNFASAQTTEVAEPESFHGLVAQVGKLIRKVDSEYLKSALADEAILLIKETRRQWELCVENEGHFLEVSSMCRLPYYDADFGWGRPIWATMFVLHMENFVSILDTNDGDGIEAWVTLNDQNMANFESEYKLLIRDFGARIFAKI